MNVSQLLTESFYYLEGEFKPIRGLNYKRKMLKEKRNLIRENIPIKQFNIEMTHYVKSEVKRIKYELHKYRCSTNVLKSIVDKYVVDMFKPRIVIENQMGNEDAHGSGSVSQHQSSNVLITDARGVSGESQTAVTPNTAYVCEDVTGKYAEMVDRWYLLSKITWNTNNKFNDELSSFVLPRALISGADTAINIAPFKYHMFWHGDIEVRVQLNSNKFQVGQLQISWYYGADRDESFDDRQNVYNLSQTMHGLLDAGSSNECVLYIPYKYRSPFLLIKDKDGKRNLDLGILTIKIITVLKTASGNVNSADLAVYVRLVNSTFGGTCDRDIYPVYKIDNQMETAAALAAVEAGLRLTGLNNCDNPPEFKSPSYVVPAALHSLAAGTGVSEPMFPLRLDPRGQNSGTFCSILNDKNTIYDIARVYGFTSQIVWSKTVASGTQLVMFPARPCLSFSQYASINTGSVDYAEARALPPVAIVNSLFAQWRGSLEYRFDVIASMFHTGRLMVSYIPLCERVDKISLTMAKSSYHATFDLQENRSFTFNVPYMHTDVWCRNIRSMGDSPVHNGTIGTVIVHVVNALRCPDSVASEVTMNVYVRAGTSFEVSIPIQPTLGLNFVRRVIDTDSEHLTADNESSDGLYVGRWNDFPNQLVLRWGTLAGRTANFPGAEKLFNEKRQNIYFENMDLSLTMIDGAGGTCSVVYARFFTILKRADTWTAFAFTSYEAAAKAWNEELAGRSPWLETYSCDQSRNPWATKRPLVLVVRRKSSAAQMEREQAGIILDPANHLISTGGGMLQYGENFQVLKDLCRRYQYFGNYYIKKDEMRNGNAVLFTFPATPMGMQLNSSGAIDYTQNKCRDGIIPIILSAFKFYRGSLRFKIVVPALEGLSFWIQHRPEITRLKPVIQAPSTSDSEMDMLANGYGSHLVVSVVNGILEFEVPFYQPGTYGELSKKQNVNDDNVYVNNGSIVLGYNNVGNKDLVSKMYGTRVNIYYSIGDDFEFHTFQGFPPMIDAAAISEDYPEFYRVENQGIGDSITKYIGNKATKLAEESALGKKLTDMASALTDIFRETFGENITKEKYAEFAIFVGSQIAHLLNNFTARTVAINIVSIFSFIGIKFAFLANKVISVLTRILEKFVGIPNEVLDGTSTRPKIVENNADEDGEDYFCTYISAIFTAICIYFGIEKAGTMGDGFMAKLKRLFTHDIGIAFRTGNGLYTFLKNHFIIVKHMLKKIICMLFPKYDITDVFRDKNAVGFKFLEEARTLASAATVETYGEDPLFVERIAACENVGKQILNSVLKEEADIGSRVHVEIEKHLNKISRIGMDLKRMGIYPSLRRRPFHLYLGGKPGIGKTFITDTIARLFCDEVIPHVTLGPNFICNVDCGSRFWNQCNGKQPVLRFDDLWSVTSGNVADEMLIHYLALHSNIPFTPPKASVEKKEMFYAPDLVISTSNALFANVNGVENEALNRRRHMLVEVKKAKLDPINNPDCDHCRGICMDLVPVEHLEDFHHLEFYIIPDPKDPASVTNDIPALDYDTFSQRFLEAARAQREKEDEIYDEKMKYFDERCVKIEGSTLRERLENERHEHVSWLEKLADRELNFSSLATNIKKGIKDIISKVGDRLYILPSVVDNQADEEPGTSNPIYIDNETRIAVGKKLTPHFEHLLCSDEDKKKFYGLKSSGTIIDECENFLKKQVVQNVKKKKGRVTFMDFYKHLKRNTFCRHLIDDFFETTYYDGKFWLGENIFVEEDYRCAAWCVCDSEFGDYVFTRWIKACPVKKIYYARRTKTRLPKRLHDSAIESGGWYTVIASEIEIWTKRLYDSIAKNSYLQAAVSFIKKTGIAIFNMLKGWCLWLVPLLTIVAANYYCNSNLTDRMIEAPLKVVSQSHSYDAKVIRSAKPTQTKIGVAHQAATQQAHHIEVLLRKNMVWLRVEYIKGGISRSRKFRCLMLGMRRMLILRHYLDFCEDLFDTGCNPYFYFQYVIDNDSRITGGKCITIPLLDLPRIDYHYNQKGDSNLIEVELPGTIPAAKDLTKFIATESDHSYVGKSGWLIQVDQLTTRVSLMPEKQNECFSVTPGATGKPYVNMIHSYVYDFEGKGVCGSLLIAPGLERPIIGIHVAGEANVMGIAEPLVAETFGYVPMKDRKPMDVADLDLGPVQFKSVNLTNTYFPRGTVDDRYAQHQATDTQFVPSAIQGVFPVVTEPTPLSANDERMGGVSPLERGASKHGLISEPFSIGLVRKVQQHYGDKIKTNVEPIGKNIGVLTLETAIIGDPLIPELTPLNWTSSEGFPLVKERPKGVRSKRWLFDLVEMGDGSYKLNGLNSRLKQILAHEHELRKSGIVVSTIFTDICKDEVLPKEKTKLGKTRVFSTAPVQFVIAFRQYFGDFMAAFRRTKFEAEHGIGIDVNSLEWTKLARLLQSCGPDLIAGDYSHFGYTLNAQFVAASFDIMMEWYDLYSNSPTLEEDQRIRACLANEILNVNRLAGNFVYQSACGIPSGFPATDIVNSMVNSMYIRSAWIEIMRKPLYELDQHLKIMVYGDDLLINVSPKYIDDFNTETLNKYFARYNIKFTDIDKSDQIIKKRNLDNATFLKCSFRKHPSRVGLYLAALDEISIHSAANWIHSRDDRVEATIENAKQCLELAHGHGPEYYNSIYEKLKTAFREKLNFNFTYLDWGDIDERRYGEVGSS